MPVYTGSAARAAVFASTCLALNVGLGKVANLLALPLAFDTVGTIIGAVLLPWPYSLLVAVSSSILGGLFIHPAFPFYVGTQVAIALAAIAAAHYDWFGRLWTAAFCGFGIGILSAVVSAPVTAIVFGGVAVPSITTLNILFLASGEALWKSVIQGALVVESIDKTIAGVLVYLVLSRMPSRIRQDVGRKTGNVLQ